MRNPNGYGGITKLPGKRRKPYRIRITEKIETIDGKTKQTYKTLGYYEKHRDAIAALEKYNSGIPEVVMSDLTFKDIYDKWSEMKYNPEAPKPIAESSINNYKVAFAACEPLHNKRFAEIKSAHLQDMINGSEKNEPTLKKIRNLLSQLYGYAIANDIVSKDYSDYLQIKKSDPVIERVPFSDDEIKTLWASVDIPWVQTVLIMIYTGLRISELLHIETGNVHLDEKYMQAVEKTKSEAGYNRVIPLHNRIIPLIKSAYNPANKYLIKGARKAAITYGTYREYWDAVMLSLSMSHLPHDCRHTFATLAKQHGIDEFSRKLIIGHASDNLTDRVYTHVLIQKLIEEVNKIP